MDFVVVALIFGLLVLGLVLVVQGIIGGEPTFEHQHVLDRRIVQTQVEHPPERHRARLILIGAGLMILAIIIGALVL